MLRQSGKLGVAGIPPTGHSVQVHEVLGWLRFFFIHLPLSISSVCATGILAKAVNLSLNMDYQFSYKNTCFHNGSWCA